MTVENLMKVFDISDDSLRDIKDSIGKELELGLSDEDKATIKMLITYVREMARGDESGLYLALDLGGTHFRVLLVELQDGRAKVTSVVHDIPHSLLVTQNGQELFDYIALKLLEFVKQYKLKRKRISLGFTFSFPCKQYGLTQSVLVKWCKGFNVGGVVGTDVVKQLKDALKRQLAGLVEAYIDVVAVINDTTGTLVACANTHKDCRIGLIVGTGYNACYIERLDRCEKWPANYTSPKQVIINCEWGAMGDNKDKRELDKFRNEFDRQIDDESVNKKNQTYEKMVSGMYIGEMLRLAMLKLYANKALFVGMPDVNFAPAAPPSAAPSTASTRTRSPSSGSLLSATSSAPSSPVSTSAALTAPASPASAASTSSQALVSASSSPVLPGAAPATEQPNGHKLRLKDALNGKHLSMIAKDELNGNFDETSKVMSELGISKYTQADLAAVVKLCSKIMHRSAHLVACGISALLERIKRPFTVIGYDGSVIKHHPYFLERLAKKCAQLTTKEYKFEFTMSSDGSGIGAAVVAAALHKERRPLYVLKPGKLYEMHYAKAQQSSLSLLDDNNTNNNHRPFTP